MRVVEINGGVFGSTGRIIEGIRDVVLQNGDKMLVAAPVTLSNRNAEPSYPYYKIGSYRKRQLSVLMDRIFSVQNAFAFSETRKLIQEIDRFQPDIIHLHSIHGGYLNIGMFFRYLSQSKAKVVWTLHDCWAFTGHCPHFTAEKCTKWISGCYSCPRFREYPRTFFDDSQYMWKKKKAIFTQLKQLTIVTPSEWLQTMVQQSYLKHYPTYVINNGIDTSVFKNTTSNFRKRYHCEDKTIILGVAFGWGYRKGLDVFTSLADQLSPDMVIVLVGTDDEVDGKLPPNIISIHRTDSQEELAEIYSSADVLFNPTREDTFPTVNIEALACGLPVVTFRTGGSPEIVGEDCGCIIEETSNVAEIIRAIKHTANKRHEFQDNCICRANALYKKTERYQDYYELFSGLLDSKSE